MPNKPVKVDKKKRDEFLSELTSFMQNKGVIWGPFPEIYGGVAGFYSYGPIGKLLKDKVEGVVRRTFQSHQMWEVECPIVLPDIVWKASGHLDTFDDRIIKCTKCKSAFRADKLIEEEHDVSADAFSDKELLDFINKNKIKCASCNGELENKINKQSLMMKTKVAGEDSSLRPETATVTYLPYKRYYEYFRRKLPFGVFQIGKAFRNEISPRQSLLRSREFTQAEGQIFVDPKEKNNWEKFDEVKKDKLPLWNYNLQKSNKKHEITSVDEAVKKKYFKTKAYAWCVWLAYNQFLNMGIPSERIRIRQHHPDEKAFYADDAWDIEINLNSFGWTEVCGVHDRADYDLRQHSKHSKEELTAKDESNKDFFPHIIEIAFGIDRPVFALLDIFYSKLGKDAGKTMFKLPYHLSPIDVAIFPLLKKDGLPEKAIEIKKLLEKEFVVEYDYSGSIGKRYLRAAEVGTAYCVTVDHDSLKKNDITLRDRDSEKQKRIKIKDLNETVRRLLNGSISFSKL
ncbi:MAG: glycine--tRNA ligase [Nanoarchaeota archaeon]|nr:glycine--tRNA ligase [Nanoarchaeota archaeon]